MTKLANVYRNGDVTALDLTDNLKFVSKKYELSVVKSRLLLRCPLLGSHSSGVLEHPEKGTLIGKTRLKAYGRHLHAGVRTQQFFGVL